MTSNVVFRISFLVSPFFQNSLFDILKCGFAAKYYVVNGYVRGLDSLSFMAEAKETGINGFHFDIIRIFFFDSPGQSTEISSPLSGGSIGIDRYFDHNNSPPFLKILCFLVTH
jgi:hypothetical protein